MSRIYASSSVESISTDKLSKSLISYFKKGLETEAFPFISAKIKEAMADNLLYVISNTEAIEALRGGRKGDVEGNDLPAEYGLTTEMAADGVNAIIDEICSADNVEVRLDGVGATTSKSVKLNFKVTWLKGDYVERLLARPEGTYDNVAEGGNEEVQIPWFYWMLKPDGLEIDGYNIIYGKPDAKKGAYSRSDRAIMISNKNSVYGIPTVLVSINGKDFIHETLTNPKFKQLANETIRRTIIESMNAQFRKSLTIRSGFNT